MKVARLFTVCTLGFLLLVTSFSQVLAAENMVANPRFADADQAIPPSGWSIYGTLGKNTITLVNADNPEQRALHIADTVAASGAAGEIGLTQKYIPIEANQAYRLTASVKGVPGATTDGAQFQLRFLPSGTRLDIPFGTLSTTEFTELVIEGTAPADDTSVVIYIYTMANKTPQFLLREVTLLPI